MNRDEWTTARFGEGRCACDQCWSYELRISDETLAVRVVDPVTGDPAAPTDVDAWFEVDHG